MGAGTPANSLRTAANRNMLADDLFPGGQLPRGSTTNNVHNTADNACSSCASAPDPFGGWADDRTGRRAAGVREVVVPEDVGHVEGCPDGDVAR